MSKEILKDDEIDLIVLTKLLWSSRRFILKIVMAFAFVGLVIAFTSKVEFKASCKLMPESQEGMKGSLGSLGGLAGLAGINLDLGSAGNLTPELYPEIVKSVPFQLQLINEQVRFESLDTITSCYYFFKELENPSMLSLISEYSIGLPGKIKSFFSSDNIITTSEFIKLTKEDWELLEEFSERITVSISDETGIININTELPDAFAAAKINSLVVEKLTNEIIKYKTEKVQVNLDFIEERYGEAKSDYERRQNNVAIFTDQNKNVTSSLVQTEYQRLQNELNIAFEVYKGLASQLEQAKIKVKEETPVFTVLEPIRIPEEKSKPKRRLILLGFSFIGILVGIGIILFKQFSLRWN